jgi:hypothetical protein
MNELIRAMGGLPRAPTKQWKKSSRSNGNGGNNCVEVAFLDTVVAVRDSKNKTGPALAFDPLAWTEFIDSVQVGYFDRRQ